MYQSVALLHQKPITGALRYIYTTYHAIMWMPLNHRSELVGCTLLYYIEVFCMHQSSSAFSVQ